MRKFERMLLDIVCILWFLEVVRGSNVIAPKNRAVVVGQRMEMECRTEGEAKIVEWKLQRSSKNDEHVIFSNWQSKRINFTDFGADVNENGSGFIYSNKTRLKDAGIYICTVEVGRRQPVHYQAHLIVLEKEPFCWTNLTSNYRFMDNNSISFACNVSFSGQWAPAMSWTLNCNEETKRIGQETIMTVTKNSSVASNITVPADFQIGSCNISCNFYFTWQNVSNSETTANNTPSYTYTWKYLWNSNSVVYDALSTVDTHTMSIYMMTQGWIISLAIVLPAVLLIIIVCVACCVCFTCYKKNATALLFNLANFLQRGNTKEPDVVLNSDGNQNKWAKESRVRCELPKIPSVCAITNSPERLGSRQDVGRVKIRESEGKETRNFGVNAEAVQNKSYDIAQDDLHYSTLARGLEPPKCDSVYARKCDSTYSAKCDSTYPAKCDSMYGTQSSSIYSDIAGATSKRCSSKDLPKFDALYSTATNSVYCTATDSLYAELNDD